MHDYLGRQTTTFTAPANAPIDLNSAGKPDWRELAPMFGLIVLCVIIAGMGFALVIAVWPRAEGDMNGWRLIRMVAGGGLLFTGGTLFLTLRTNVLYWIEKY